MNIRLLTLSLATVLLMTVVGCGTIKQTTSLSKEEMRAKVKNAIENNDISILIDQYTSVEGSRNNSFITPIFNIKNSVLSCELPYNGNIYGDSNRAYGKKNSSLKLSVPIEMTVIEKDNGEGYVITFPVKSSQLSTLQEVLDVNIDLAYDGKAIIKIDSTRRDSITYYGNIE